MFHVNNKDTRTTPIFIVNIEHISHLVLVFLFILFIWQYCFIENKATCVMRNCEEIFHTMNINYVVQHSVQYFSNTFHKEIRLLQGFLTYMELVTDFYM